MKRPQQTEDIEAISLCTNKLFKDLKSKLLICSKGLLNTVQAPAFTVI